MSVRKYCGDTLEKALAELELWKRAKRAAATGQSYSIEGRQLTRQNLPLINAEIDRYSAIVETLSGGISGPVFVTARMRR